MAQASDYPITFGYGATDDTYYGPKAQGKSTYIGPYHKGDDRAMPVGTPVVVNGVTIGLSGSGNGRYGPHLHTARFVGGGDTNPHGGGFQLDGAKVIAVVDNYASDPVNAKYVRIQDSSGAQWLHLHMSQINVKVGQVLQGGEDIVKPTKAQVLEAFQLFLGKEPKDNAELQYYLDRDSRELYKSILFDGVRPKKADVKTVFNDLVGRDPNASQLDYYPQHDWGWMYKDLAYELKKSQSVDFKPYTGDQLFTQVKKG